MNETLLSRSVRRLFGAAAAGLGLLACPFAAAQDTTGQPMQRRPRTTPSANSTTRNLST